MSGEGREEDRKEREMIEEKGNKVGGTKEERNGNRRFNK